MRVALAVSALFLAVGCYQVAVYRFESDLRESAPQARKWSSKRASPRPITDPELARFPRIAREEILSACFREGGDPRRDVDCYAEASSWMLSKARDQAQHRNVGYACVSLGLLLAGATLLVERRKRRQLAVFEEPS